MSLINTWPENSSKQLTNLEFLHQSKSKTKFITNSADPEMKL